MKESKEKDGDEEVERAGWEFEKFVSKIDLLYSRLVFNDLNETMLFL